MRSGLVPSSGGLGNQARANTAPGGAGVTRGVGDGVYGARVSVAVGSAPPASPATGVCMPGPLSWPVCHITPSITPISNPTIHLMRITGHARPVFVSPTRLSMRSHFPVLVIQTRPVNYRPAHTHLVVGM